MQFRRSYCYEKYTAEDLNFHMNDYKTTPYKIKLFIKSMFRGLMSENQGLIFAKFCIASVLLIPESTT